MPELTRVAFEQLAKLCDLTLIVLGPAVTNDRLVLAAKQQHAQFSFVCYINRCLLGCVTSVVY